jgi:FkbM family methyltransferase
MSIQLNSVRWFKTRFFQLAVFLCVTFAIAAAIVQAFPILILPFLGLKSDSSFCSTFDAMSDFHILIEQKERAENIASSSHKGEVRGALDFWATPLGDYWTPNGSAMMIATLLAQQERGIYGSGEWGVQAGDTVIDCGAHVGVFARKALDAGAALVVAVEPGPPAVECLRLNFAAEIESGRVVIVPKGVWDEEDMLPLFDNGNSGAANSFIRGVGAPSVTIPVTTIDALKAELKLARIDFIKMDVKGATIRALQGALQTIQNDRPTLALSTE